MTKTFTSLMTDDRKFSNGKTILTKPNLRASSEFIVSPEIKSLVALPTPINLLRFTVPPQPAIIPSFTSGCPKIEFSDAYLK